MGYICGVCGQEQGQVWRVLGQWRCIWCIDPMAFPDLRTRVRFSQLRARAILADIRKRRAKR